MLYSLNFMKNREHRRLLFYAEDRQEAEWARATFAERSGTPEENITLESHPRGYAMLGRTPRYWPAQQGYRSAF